MRDNNKFIIIVTILFLLLITSTVQAAGIKINAGVLPSIWYSSLNISKNDQVNIFGGIQNHSNIGFSFTAVIYIDSTLTRSSSFVSNPDTLTEISYPWTAVAGSHTAQLKITNIVSLDKAATTTIDIDSLLSSESDKVTISVNQNITLNDIETTITKLAVNTVDAINNLANNLANNVEELKKPVSTDTSAVIKDSVSKSNQMLNSKNKQVIGTVTKSISNNKTGISVSSSSTEKSQLATVAASIMDSKIFTSIYNRVLDFLSLIIKNWKVTLFIILVLVFSVKYII